MKSPSNLFADVTPRMPDEDFRTLLETAGVRIERIVSHGHASPPGFWQVQEQHEWVVVLKGSAKVFFEGDRQPTAMEAGHFVNIPAHTKHRIEWTTPEEPTLWLAVYYGNPPT